MLMVKLIDHIWATKKAESLNGYKLLLAEIMSGKSKGDQLIVVDNISAGIGESVIVCTGSSARRMLENDNLPVDAVVVGIIDANCDPGKQK